MSSNDEHIHDDPIETLKEIFGIPGEDCPDVERTKVVFRSLNAAVQEKSIACADELIEIGWHPIAALAAVIRQVRTSADIMDGCMSDTMAAISKGAVEDE